MAGIVRGMNLRICVEVELATELDCGHVQALAEWRDSPLEIAELATA
jgi:hypothetical protein